MSFPGFLLSAWYDVLSGARMTRGKAGINAFRTYLNGGSNETIRFYIAGTTGMGHQASSANLIRRLCQPVADDPAGYNYAGTIQIYIDDSAGFAPYDVTLQKMLLLLPEKVVKSASQYTFYQATIEFFKKAKPPATQVNLGFTGGADPDDHYAAALNVAYFLRLQPYRWAADNQLQFIDNKYPYVILDNQYVLGYHMFVERAYVQPITVPDWDKYADNQQALIIQWLTDAPQLARFDFQPIYSIRYPAKCELNSADQRLTFVLAATLAAQQQSGKPAIVVNLDVYDTPLDNSQFGLTQIAGMLANTSELSSDEFYATATAARKQAFKPLNASKRFDFLIYDPLANNNLATLQTMVANWLLTHNSDKVLFVQLARKDKTISPDVFSHAFSVATLPTVFEGQNSANLSLNIGSPYFHVNRPSSRGTEQYPGDILSVHGGSAIGAELQKIADQIATGFNEWPLTQPGPITIVRDFIANRHTPKYTDYFTGMRTFYRDPIEDKFNLSLCFTNYIINGKQAARLRGDMAEADDGDTLDSIYTAFSTAIQGGKPVVFLDQLDASSQIATFIASVEEKFGAFVTDNTAVTRDPISGDITQVTVTGTTAMFGSGVVAALQADFTAPDGVVSLTCRYTGDVAWRPEGVPWIGFGGPFIEFTVVDADLVVAGKVGGRLLGADIDFYAVLPPNDGALLFAGDFVSPPSLTKLFQVAGGVNLVASLPPPLSIITQLELTHVEFATQTSGSPLSFSIEYFFFELAWKPADPNAGWQLLPNLTLEDILIGISLPVPGSENALKANIGGNFRIGNKTDPDAAQVSVSVTAPELTYEAQLTTGEIKLTDLIGMFVPGVAIDPPSQPAITQFSLSGVQKTGDFLLSCQLGFDWEIPSNDLALLELKDIGLMANRTGGETTGQLTGSVTLLPNDSDNALTLALTADYLGKDDGWKFSAQQTSDDQQLSLLALIAKYLIGFDAPQDYGINGISVTATPSAHAYSIAGKTAEPWSLPFMSSLTVSASMDLSYDPAQKGSPYSGNLSATVTWSQWSLMKIDLACVFGEGKSTYTIDWGAFHAEIAKNDEEQWVAKGKLSGVTLGGIIEDFISFATGSRYGLGAPWNLLDSVPLDNFQLTFNFTTKAIGFDITIGSIDLGFCSITGITVNYDGSNQKPLVQVTLDGTFPWTTEAPSWNATNPDETPAPPGGGNEFLDLRLLALGQHVEVTSTEPFTTVEAVIKALRNLDADGAPIAGPNCNVKFNPNNSWLVGADFGVMKIKDEENQDNARALIRLDDDPTPDYVVNLSIIFNDPNLYGARIALAGPPAKVLGGLVFEVLYRRISDTIGVYQINLTLPDRMRKFDIGAYSLTLPMIALDIYTNGDFKVDFGFPWNQDFSRSFMVQGIIPPGIPVLGAAGFYFGKLSHDTSTQVPSIDNGRFDPVIIFGFGVTIGIGKDVDYGILKAGFSLTVFGIIQGVIAKFCPYPGNTNLPATPAQLQNGYYFELDGTFGIIGGLYGSVDFVIIKASVSITIKVMAQITYISYHDIPISLIASVDVTASLSIDLGIFSITIHFSFSMTIKETFTIQNPNKNAPWHVTADSRPALLTARHRNRLSAANELRRVMLASNTDVKLYWDNLAPMTQVALTGYWGPALTVSGDAAAKASDQKVCYANMLAIASSDPTVPRKPTDTDTSFDLLAQQVLRWIVAAAQPQKKGFYTVDLINNVVVSPDDLSALLTALTNPAGSMPISADDADSFMTNQFALNVSLPSSGTFNAAPFPVAPKLVLDVPGYGTTPPLSYAFANFNSASSTYIEMLRTYFDDLTVQVEKETAKKKSLAAVADAGMSVASFVFSDYFRLIGQQMIEAARDALRSFKYPLTNPPNYGASAGAAVQWINSAGAPEFGPPDLFEANPAHAFATQQSVFIYGAATQTGAHATFTSIAADYNNLFTPLVLATVNAATSNLLVANAVITYNGKPITVAEGDSLNDIAAKAGVTLSDLFTNAPALLTQPDLIATSATFTVPGGASSQASENATFNSIASAYQNLFSGTALAIANAASINLLTPGLGIEYPNKPTYILLPRDSLNSVAAQFGVALADLLQHATVAPDHISVLGHTGLIPTFVPLALPNFTYPATDSDTPGSVAQRFGVTVRALGIAANAGVTFEQVKVTTLDLPHLAQLKVGALIDEIKRTNGLSRISGMTGRYALHGLRLPTAGLTQTVASLCGTAVDCGLYSLTGQQFALPPLATQDFSFSLVVPDNLPWVKFGGPKLTMTLKPPKDPKNATANDDQNWLKVVALQSFVGSNQYVVSPPGTTVGPDPVYRDQPTTWPTTELTSWQSAGSVTLPYGVPPTGVQALRLWGLPTTLLNLDDVNRAAPPCALAMRGEYDEGSGQTVETELQYHGWATKVGLTIKQIPPNAGSPSSAFTYQLIGSGEADIVLLERLLAKLCGHSDPVQSLTLLYSPDASTGTPTGLQSDNSSTVTLGILQANLSTVTNPPNVIATQRLLDTTSGGCLNTAYDFVKLLWECSITRSGGYYLYYFENAAGNGFPSRIFNDKGEASLTLLVIQAKPNDASQQDLVGGFINCMATGDSFDATKSAVYAKSAATQTTYQPLATDSLAAFAYRYYMDPVALAEANPNARLAAKPLTLARGVYQVNAGQPGGDPNTIASYFATTLAMLQAANPQITTWNTPLALDTVLRLPTLQLTVGTSAGGTTLSSIAAYYGSNVSEIAADNADTVGLLAIQDLIVPGGPMSRSSTVPAGCIALAASRDVPKPVPPPTDATFARLYMQNQIVLLGYRIFDNAWFKQTNPGLPISHSDAPPAHLAADRTRTPMAFALNSDALPWNFQRAIPAAQNAKPNSQNKLASLPDPSKSPYMGVGGLAQLDLGWVDAFGNTAKSDIGNNPDGSTTRNRSPLPLNYVDALVGLGRWPSVSMDYSVQDSSGLTIGLGLHFDPSGYSPDPNDPSPQTNPPGWQVNATQALHVYNLMYQQLSQTLGPKNNPVPAVTLALATSLLPATDLTLSAATREGLMTWLFGQDGLYPFLVARSGGDTTFPAPADHPIGITFTLADINPEQLFELTTTFTLSRPKTLVDPAFADTPGFVSATTALMPHQVKAADGTYSLIWFASQLEACLTQPGAWACKLASGADRAQATQAGAIKPLWLVRLGLAANQGISYRVANTINPLIFAPKPLYNTLQSRPLVAYYNYVSGKGIDFTKPSGNQQVTAVDVDGWMRDYLAAVDTIFSPEYLAPVALVDRSNTLQKQLRDIKEQLATSLSHLVIAFFTDESPTKRQTDAAQEAFKQQALIALSNVYSVNAVVQFAATVTAKIDTALEQETPQLYGTLLTGPNSDTGVSLTAAKVALSTTEDKTSTPLTFLVTATKDPKDSQGAVKSVVTLDLTYHGSQIEHQIGQLPNIEHYKASSWLSFVTQPDHDAINLPLDVHLGPFQVPLPLRIFPTPPSMVSQDAIITPLRKPIDWENIVEAMQWDYSFTYSESFHYPQDQTHFTTTFNIPDPALAKFAVTADPVPDLFEFITVYPQVQADLTGTLAGITQQSSTDDVTKAAIALGAFVQLVQNVSSTLAQFLPPPQDAFAKRALAVIAQRGQLPYTYVISESSIDKINPNDNVNNVVALLTKLRPLPPEGIDTPSINISGYVTEQQAAPAPDFDLGYCYTTAQGYLSDVIGQAIAKRTVLLPGLNILSAQSALTCGYIERNQDLIHGRTTADPFVYQTASVAFPAALRPTIDIPDAIDVASFGGNTPVARTFADQLTNLFTILFAKAPAGPQTIQVSTAYAILLNSSLPIVGTLPVPISFLPPTAMQPDQAALHATSSTQGVLIQQQLIEVLRNGIYAWWNAYNPKPNGTLIFNLTIMTSTQGAGLPPMPLLVLEQLTLDYSHWSDHPLPTT
jgi:LysM repeat protein